MPVNKDKLQKLIVNEAHGWIRQAESYEQNKDWLEKSALIAIKILRTLRSKSITQKDLAEQIEVSPQYINKVVKGSENLTLETICKIEKNLGIKLIEVPVYEHTQVINDSFLPFSSQLNRNNRISAGSAAYDYQVPSTYSPEDNQLVA